MAFKPNYNQQRAVRSRAKEQKKQEKLARKQDETGKPDETATDGTAIEETAEADQAGAAPAAPQSGESLGS